MQVVEASGRTVTLSGTPLGTASRLLGDDLASRKETIKLVAGPDGRSRRIRYAEVARANPGIRTSVAVRGGLASRIDLHVFRPKTDEKDRLIRERVRPGDGGSGSTLAAVLRTPEPGISARKLKRRMAGDILVQGNAIAEKLMSGGQLIGLRWHPWTDVKVHLSDDGLSIEAFEVPVTRTRGMLGSRMLGETRFLDRGQVLHLTLDDDTEEPVGVSPIHSLHHTHALHDAALRFAVGYLDQGVFPSGMVEVPKEASKEQVLATRLLIESLYRSPERAGKPFVAMGKWQQISATPEGSKLIELAKLSREEVGIAYQTTSILSPGDSNKATAQVERTRFIRDVVGGDVAIFESETNAQIIGRSRRWTAEGIFVEGEMGEMLRPDLVELSKVIQREVGAPVLTPNEGRGLLNKEPLPDDIADTLILNPGTPGSGTGGGGSGVIDEDRVRDLIGDVLDERGV